MKKITQKELAKRINVTEHTLINWKKTKPELIKLINLGLEAEKSGGITINGNNNIIGSHNKIMINGNDICKEICEALGKLPEQKQKKFYHKIMLELFEEMENET